MSKKYQVTYGIKHAKTNEDLKDFDRQLDYLDKSKNKKQNEKLNPEVNEIDLEDLKAAADLYDSIMKNSIKQ